MCSMLIEKGFGFSCDFVCVWAWVWETVEENVNKCCWDVNAIRKNIFPCQDSVRLNLFKNSLDHFLSISRYFPPSTIFPSRERKDKAEEEEERDRLHAPEYLRSLRKKESFSCFVITSPMLRVNEGSWRKMKESKNMKKLNSLFKYS